MATEKSTQQDSQDLSQSQVEMPEATVVEPITDENIEQTPSEEQPLPPVDFSDEEARLAAAALDIGDAEEEEELPSRASRPKEWICRPRARRNLWICLKGCLHRSPFRRFCRRMEAVKIAFYKKHRAEVEECKKAFVEAGGAAEAFVPSLDAEELRLKDLVGEYRRRRDEFLAGLESAKQENLKIKLGIIEELKKLIDSGETLGQTFATFRELQNRWKETGPVPRPTSRICGRHTTCMSRISTAL